MTTRSGRVQAAVYALLPHLAVPSTKERDLLTRVGLHIEQAMRVRLGHCLEVAVVSPEGKVVHAEGQLRAREQSEPITSQVRAIESARARPADDGVMVRTGLVKGMYSLSPREEGGRRHYAVLEYAEQEEALQLAPREMRIVELAAQGLSNKMIAYSQGLSQASISRSLSSAALKMGCTSVGDLVGAASLLLCASSEPVTWRKAPSAAELQVLHLLRHGYSNREIAEARNCAPRTVANQVASLLKKAPAISRRDLMRHQTPAE